MLSATKLKKAKTLKVLDGEINSRHLIDLINASPDIEELDLRACEDMAAFSDIMQALKRNDIKNISSLIINTHNICPRVFGSLAEMFQKNHTIKKIEDSCGGFFDVHYYCDNNSAIIKYLNANSTLTSLKLLNSLLTTHEIDAIADMLRVNKALASLVFSLHPVSAMTRSSYSALTAAIKGNTSLTSLTLRIYFSELDELITALEANYSLTEINLIPFFPEEDNGYELDEADKLQGVGDADFLERAQKSEQAFLQSKAIIQDIIKRNKVYENKEETHLAVLGPGSEMEMKRESDPHIQTKIIEEKNFDSCHLVETHDASYDVDQNEVISYQGSKEDASAAEAKEEKIFDPRSLIEEIYDNNSQDELLFQTEVKEEDKQHKENDHLFLERIKGLITANLIGGSLTPLLSCAAYFGYEETVAYLLEQKPCLDFCCDHLLVRVDSNFSPVLYNKLTRGSTILKGLGIPVSWEDQRMLESSWPPLLFAALQKHYSIAEKLIAAGAEVNIKIYNEIEKEIYPIVYWLVKAKKYSAMRFFISRGADGEAMDYNGSRALHYSALFNDIPGAEILIRSGVKINPKAKRDRYARPYEVAATSPMRTLFYSAKKERCERVFIRHQAYAIAQLYTQVYKQHSAFFNKIPSEIWCNIMAFLDSSLEPREAYKIRSAAFLSMLNKRKALASAQTAPQKNRGFLKPKNHYRNPKVEQSLLGLKNKIAEQITYYNNNKGFRYKIKAARLQAALDRAKNITDFASMQELYNFKGGRNTESIKEAFSYARWGGFFYRKRQSQEKIESFIRNYEYKR